MCNGPIAMPTWFRADMDLQCFLIISMYTKTIYLCSSSVTINYFYCWINIIWMKFTRTFDIWNSHSAHDLHMEGQFDTFIYLMRPTLTTTQPKPNTNHNPNLNLTLTLNLTVKIMHFHVKCISVAKRSSVFETFSRGLAAKRYF